MNESHDSRPSLKMQLKFEDGNKKFDEVIVSILCLFRFISANLGYL